MFPGPTHGFLMWRTNKVIPVVMAVILAKWLLSWSCLPSSSILLILKADLRTLMKTEHGKERGFLKGCPVPEELYLVFSHVISFGKHL